jgi:signal transduction histidine kinase
VKTPSQVLHDEIGPLLSAAGLKLQLIKMDYPETATLVREVTEVLDQAIDQVRQLSNSLDAAKR